MVNFPTRIPNPDSHNPALLDLLIFSDASFCSSVTVIMWLSQFLVSFRQNDSEMPRFIAYLMTIKRSASAAASEFCEWVQIGIEAASSNVTQS